MTYTTRSYEQPFVSFTRVDDSMSPERMLQVSGTDFRTMIEKQEAGHSVHTHPGTPT